MTTPSDIAGLSDLLDDLREGPISFHDARTKMHRAATQLDSLSARVKELEAERDRLTQRIAEKDDEIQRQRDLREATERRLSAAKGRVTRIKNRVAHGVCPCCNRSFANLHRHMTTEHPMFTAEAAE